MLALPVLIISLFGLFISGYVLFMKRHRKKMYCFFGLDCNKVLYSKYGRMLGVDNAFLGILFYLFMIFFSVVEISSPGAIAATDLMWYFFIATLIAVLVSLMLFRQQLFLLRSFCEYCLSTMLFNFLILIFMLV